MIRRFGVPLLLLLAAAAPLRAQEGSLLEGLLPGSQEAPAGPEAAQAESPPAAIPVEQIPVRLRADHERIRRATDLLARDTLELPGDTSEVRGEPELAGALSTVDAILDNFDSIALERLRASVLREYEQALRREQGRLERSARELSARFAEAEDVGRRIDRSRTEWRLTLDSLATDTLATADIVARAQAIEAALDSVAGRLRARIGRLVQMGETVANAERRLDAALGRLGRVQETRRRLLFVRDAPALWNLGAVVGEGRPLVGDVAAYTRRDLRAFRESISADLHRVGLHLLIFLGTLLLLLTIRVRVRHWPDEPRTHVARFVLERPWAAAFLMALLATRWAYPHASLLVFDVAFVLGAIAVVRLVPTSMPVPTRRAVYAFALLAALSRAVALLPPDGLARRVAILGVGVGALAVLLSVRRRSRAQPGAAGPGPWETAGRLAIDGLIVLLTASLLLNAAGWSDLGSVLATGAISAGFLAIVFALAAMVAEGIVRGILAGPIARRSHALALARKDVRLIAVRAIRLLALLFWVRATFAAFGLDRALFGWVGGLFGHQFSIGAVELSLGRIVLFGLVIWVTVKLGAIVKALLRDDVFPRLAMPPGKADAYSTLAHWAILLAGILFAAASAGFGGSNLAVIAGALSVGIGFGLQNIVNNFVSGFILIFEQPIKAGDKVELRGIDLYGEVKRIGIRSSTIRTFDGADVIVPNSNVIQSEVVNWTLTDPTRRIEVDVGLAYGTPPDRVVELLVATARATPGVLPEPEPFALFMGFGDSSLNFRLLAWAATFDEFVRLRSVLAIAVERAVREAGFEIPFPQRDLHLRSVDGGAAATLRDRTGEQVRPAAGEPAAEG